MLSHGWGQPKPGLADMRLWAERGLRRAAFYLAALRDRIERPDGTLAPWTVLSAGDPTVSAASDPIAGLGAGATTCAADEAGAAA